MWQKVLSEKYQQHYWFNSETGESRWEEPIEAKEDIPESSSQPLKRQRVETETQTSTATVLASSTEGEGERKQKSTYNTLSDIDIAIIVPFRDLHHEQKRAEQLARFIPEMTRRCSFLLSFASQSLLC
jgi:hypothetical protein